MTNNVGNSSYERFDSSGTWPLLSPLPGFLTRNPRPNANQMKPINASPDPRPVIHCVVVMGVP